MRHTVVIIHPGALGDMLLALRAIRSIRECFYQHDVVLLAQASAARLLHSCKEVDQVEFTEGPVLSSLMAGRKVYEEIPSWLLHCDLVIAWANDGENGLEAAFSHLGIPHIVTSPHLREFVGAHQSDRFLDTIRSVVPASDSQLSLQLPTEIMVKADSRMVEVGLSRVPPLIIIHPGSGSRHKCMSAHRIADIVQWYRDRGTIPLIVGGPADAEQVTQLQELCSESLCVFHTFDLQLMAGIIARADLFIGHDSGLTHLAATLGVSTVAIFGPTDPSRWAPRGPHVRVVTGPSCHCEGWGAVRSCGEQPCLQIPLDHIMDACTSAYSALT
jgi:heptosyltransferase-3